MLLLSILRAHALTIVMWTKFSRARASWWTYPSSTSMSCTEINILSIILLIRRLLLLPIMIQLLQILLQLKMCPKRKQILPQINDHLHLCEQKLVELVDILLNVTSRLVHLSDQCHLFFLAIDYLIDMCFVLIDELFFLLKNVADQRVVVLVDLLEVLAVVPVHLGVVR